MRQAANHLYAIVRIRVLFWWYCVVRDRPELFIPVMEQERRELGL